MIVDYDYFACVILTKFLFNADERFISINNMNKLVVILYTEFELLLLPDHELVTDSKFQ